MPASIEILRRILFVDDDTVFLEMIARMAGRWSQGAWQVHLASTTAQALALLQEHRIDLAVIDIRMPVVDGLQFLQLLHRKHPTLQLVTMSGYASEDQRAACLSQGAVLFLEKPRTPDGFETVFATLNELAALQPQEGFRGVLRQVGLPDVLQMECLGRNSSILEISNATVRGRIFIQTGDIIHAELGDQKGEAAFNGLLALRGGEFNLKPFTQPPERSINAQWEFLLMESARVRDEELHQQSESGAVAEPDLKGAYDPMPANVDTFLATAPAPAGEAVPARIDEVLVCSAQDEVLYQWQCPGIETRLKLFEFISRKAAQLRQGLPLGNFDRLEVIGPQSRTLAQILPDRKILVRSSPVETGAPAGEARLA